MQDFNSFSKNDKSNNIMDMVKDLSKKFDGKDSNELLKAIYKEGEKNKKNGTLTNNDLDNFQRTISPFLDSNQKKVLTKLIDELKKI